jgi:hypothetical protein
VIDRAAAAGTLDVGVETYKADRISKVSEQTVYTDARSGAETKHVHLNVQNRNRPVDFDATLAGRNKTNGKKPDAFVQNERSGRVFAVTEAGSRTDADGRVTEQVRLTSPTDYQFVERSALKGGNWKRLTVEQARPLWDKQVADTPEFRNSDLHLITGAVLPIWDRLGGNPKIYRLQTDQGDRMLGRVIPATQVAATLQRLGAEGIKVTETPAQIAGRVEDGAVATLANGWTIKPAQVAGESRLELVGPDYRHNEELSRHGIFSERINYQTRFFIPTEPGAAARAIEAITKNRPVTSLSDEGGPKFSPRDRRLSDYSTGPDGRTLLFEADRAHWMENHERLLAGRGTNDVRVLETNFVLRAMNGDRGPITISPRVASTIRADHPDVPESVWRNLPELLAEPTIVYPHRDGGLNFVIGRTTAKGEPIIVGVRDGAIHTITPFNDTPDATGLKRLADTVLSAVDRGDRVYARTAAFMSQLETYAAGAPGTIPLRRPLVSRRANLGYASQGSDRQSGGRPGRNLITHDDVIKTQGRTLYSPRSPDNPVRQYTAGQRQAIDNAFAKEPSTKEKIAAAREDAGRKFIRTVLDPYIGLKRDDPEAYMAARLANSSAGAFHYFLEQGPLAHSRREAMAKLRHVAHRTA